MKKYFLVVVLICLSVSFLQAQSHNTVPLDTTGIYDFLDKAQMRGFTDPLPASKPYQLSYIKKVLNQINTHRNKMSKHEREILDDYIERFITDPDKPFGFDGDVRIKDDIFPAKFGVYLNGNVSADLNNLKDSIGGSGTVGLYFKGDMGKYFSYGVDMTAGLFLSGKYNEDYSYGPTGFEPYTYTKTWDGGVHLFSSLNSFNMMPTSLAGGYTFTPEITSSFWDSRVMLRFGRSRHDWGFSEGNLFLNYSARPFFGLESTFSPWKWVSLTALSGVMDYGATFRNNSDYSIKKTSGQQQNMFAAFQLEFNPLDWLYLQFYDAVIYLKRPEWGYVYPLMSKFVNQNNTGDFDNVMMGGTLGFSWPGIFRTYFSVYLDEARFNSPNFFSNPANQYALQAGIKSIVPGIPWSELTLQYTKIEPFTYSHYASVDNPWYELPLDNTGDEYEYGMDVGYLNNGENLGYGLEPNSDEILLMLKSDFRRGITWRAKYRMIRHGFPGSVPGSTFDAWGIYDDGSTPEDDPDGAYYPGATKNFLKDGVYEWYHIIGVGATLDFRIWNEPVQMGLDYSFVALYYTNYSLNGTFKPVNSSTYPNTFRNIITFSIGVSPY